MSIRERIRGWLFPWPDRRARRAAIAAAREAYEAEVRARAEAQRLARDLSIIRDRNHFRDTFDKALRGQ